jgi:hypothetical protein
MNRTGAGGWLLSLFLQRIISEEPRASQKSGGNGHARIGTPSLLFAVLPAVYQHLLSEKDQPRPRVARYQSDNIVRLTYYF